MTVSLAPELTEDEEVIEAWTSTIHVNDKHGNVVFSPEVARHRVGADSFSLTTWFSSCSSITGRSLIFPRPTVVFPDYNSNA
jgi:N-acetylglucosamine-6-phosphate deacetylase